MIHFFLCLFEAKARQGPWKMFNINFFFSNQPFSRNKWLKKLSLGYSQEPQWVLRLPVLCKWLNARFYDLRQGYPQKMLIFLFSDNVTLNIDGVLYLRVQDPYKASYGVEDPEFAITQLAQTTMRSEIGKITLDTLFRERDNLNAAIVEAINQVNFINDQNNKSHAMIVLWTAHLTIWEI